MKKITIILSLLLLFVSSSISADSKKDTVEVMRNIVLTDDGSSISSRGLGSDVFENSAEIEPGRALFGKIPGLVVRQGQGISLDNHVWYNLHGHAPIVFVDGYRRDINCINVEEVESVQVLSDAVSAALYGVQGGNGVILFTTKRGTDSKLKINVNYQGGASFQYRTPSFFNAYDYANLLNSTLQSEGKAAKYNSFQLEAFKNGTHPYSYANVNWWDEVYNEAGMNHQVNVSFRGGSDKFKYYAALMYGYDQNMLKKQTSDSRYDTKPVDTSIGIRSNIDAEITKTTFFRLNLNGSIKQVNTIPSLSKVYDGVWNLPALSNPIRTEEGLWGGNTIFQDKNPVAQLMGHGNNRYSYTTLFADLSLKQNLDILTEGLYVDLAVALDYVGCMYDNTWNNFRYSDPNGYFLADGTLVESPIYFGKDSSELEHWQDFKNLYANIAFNANIGYDRHFGKHHVNALVNYRQESYRNMGRNNSSKRQYIKAFAEYSYAERYNVDLVVSHSGSAYLPPHHKFRTYPALGFAWVASNEDFMKSADFLDFLKIRASVGLSGSDELLSHELYLSGYTDGNGYHFGDNAFYSYGHKPIPVLPTENLVPELSKRYTVGLDFAAFKNRLTFTADWYGERRQDILLQSRNINSSIIGIDTGLQNIGVQDFKGIDLSLGWNDDTHAFKYGIDLNFSYLNTEVIKDEIGYQPWDYLYHIGNSIYQCYGLEATGFFQNTEEIANSPLQKFSNVKPGDIKYKDQNGDNIIDGNDIVPITGTWMPPVNYGFSIHLGWKGINLLADFQGCSGMTVNLLDSPLYNQPLSNNKTVSHTYMDNETPWTTEHSAQATMPRLSTEVSVNNSQISTQWLREVSFLKLRNLKLSYTFPKSLMKNVGLTVYVQGTNLFSADNLKFADPEQLAATYPSVRSIWGGISLNF